LIKCYLVEFVEFKLGCYFQIFSWMNDQMLKDVTPALLEKRPNTYTFTKSLAESLLFKHGHDLPIAVFRPAIVGASLREPMPVSYCYCTFSCRQSTRNLTATILGDKCLKLNRDIHGVNSLSKFRSFTSIELQLRQFSGEWTYSLMNKILI
jgi:hypothetical protein